MPAAQFPSIIPTPDAPPPPPTVEHESEVDIYDAQRWESAYRNLHATPELLIQLQDDLARSRKREAFWISVVVHLVLFLLIVNLDKLARFLPHRTVIVAENAHKQNSTFLELPPDLQKPTRRPKSDILSDKDRNAMSKTPSPNREDLKGLLNPAPRGPRVRKAAPAPQAAPQQPATQSAPQPAASQQPQQPPPDRTQEAKLEPPRVQAKPNFGDTSLSAGSAIAQAAKAAAANRGGYSGDNGDFGLGQGKQSHQMLGPMDVLSDTMGVDFGPYLARVLHDVRENWYNLIPEAARAPLMKRGKVSIEFAITKDGRVAGMKLTGTSGDVALDRGAWGGITASNPFPPLPKEFAGQYLALRFAFYYNPENSADLR